MAGKYLGMLNIIVAIIMYESLYVYCKVTIRLIFYSIIIECLLDGKHDIRQESGQISCI